MKWMNLPDEHSGDESKFVIIPIMYEKDPTYLKGASNGSTAIINASTHLEYYDEYFHSEPFEEGIKVINPLHLMKNTPEQMIEEVAKTSSLLKDKFPIFIGGDHAISHGTVKAMENLHDEFSIIVFDAHADFRDSWNNSQFNHACVNKNLGKKHELVMLGVRSIDVDEKRQLSDYPNVHVIYAWEDIHARMAQIIPKLKEKVFLSIDVDAFQFVTNTGTPEPGGIGWYKTLELLRHIFIVKKVIGADIVEFSPLGSDAEAYAIAKLIYKIMSLASR